MQILDIAAGVVIGNTVAMGGIAATNLFLERKRLKRTAKRWQQLDKDAEIAYQKWVETSVKPTTKAPTKKVAAPKRTKVE